MENQFLFTEYIAGASVTPVYNSFVQRSESGLSERGGGLGGYFKLSLELGRMDYQTGKQLCGFLNGLQGRLNPFWLVLPYLSESSGSYQGGIRVEGAGQAGKQIRVSGLPINQKQLLWQGDFIRFQDSSSKVYQLTQNLDSDGAGEGILNLNSLIVGNTLNDQESAYLPPGALASGFSGR